MVRAIFLGTFDPPHNGHLELLRSISEHASNYNIEKIHVIPSIQNPNKKKSTNFTDRYRMCMRAFASLSHNVVIDDIEDSFEHKYTYELIDYIKEHDKVIGNDFIWIITVETYKEILEGHWKESEKLLNECNFLIIYNSKEKSFVDSLKNKSNIILFEYIFTEEVHSTDIRTILKSNCTECPCSLDNNVFDYIKENHLYI